MTEPLPAPPEFDGIAVAKQLLRTIRAGALATLDGGSGFPFASLVSTWSMELGGKHAPR